MYLYISPSNKILPGEIWSNKINKIKRYLIIRAPWHARGYISVGNNYKFKELTRRGPLSFEREPLFWCIRASLEGVWLSGSQTVFVALVPRYVESWNIELFAHWDAPCFALCLHVGIISFSSKVRFETRME